MPPNSSKSNLYSNTKIQPRTGALVHHSAEGDGDYPKLPVGHDSLHSSHGLEAA